VFVSRYAALPYGVAAAISEFPVSSPKQEVLYGSIASTADLIYSAVAVAAPEAKKVLVGLRRDVFNRRWGKIQKNLHQFDGDVNDALRELLTLRLSADGDAARTAEKLELYLVQKLEFFRSKLLDTVIAKGLVLSSPNFLQRLQQSPIRALTSQGVTQDCATVLEYITRCSVKTSPFSYFGSVAVGFLGRDRAALFAPGVSRAVLNCEMVSDIVRTAKRRPKRIRANASLRLHGGFFYWIVQNGNGETCRRCRDPEDERLHSVMCHLSRERVIDAEEIEAEVVDILINAGIAAEFDSVLPDLTTRLCMFSQNTSAVQEPLALHATELLYNDAINSFRNGNPEERLRSLRTLTAALTQDMAAAMASDSGAGRERLASAPHTASRVVREDVVYQERDGEDLGRVYPAIERLDQLARLFEPLMKNQIQKLWIRKFVEATETKWKDLTLDTLLIRLLEIVQPRGESEAKRWDDVAALDDTDPARRGYLLELETKVSSSLHYERGQSILDLSPLLSPAPKGNGVLAAAYLHDCYGNHGADWVLSGTTAGDGRAMRRWLDTEARDCCRAWVQSCLKPNEEAAAIIDDMIFHADRGPRVLSSAVRCANARILDTFEKDYDATDLRVVPDGNHSVALRAPSGNIVYLQMDSLLVSASRPTTTKILACFCHDGGMFDIRVVVEYLTSKLAMRNTDQSTGIVYMPRIICGSGLVLSRSTWNVPVIALRPELNRLTGLDAGKLLRDWHLHRNLPLRFFAQPVYARNHSGKIVAADKPQYFDLDDPLYLLYFRKWLGRIKQSYRVTEALPDPSQMPDKTARECIFHWHSE